MTTNIVRVFASAALAATILALAERPALVAAEQGQAACRQDATYAGPPRRDPPSTVWDRDFSRSIDGALAPGLLAALEKATADIVARVPAVSVAVAIPGQGRWSATRGVSRVEPRAAVSDGQMFQAASATKTFTAAAVMQLVGEGRLRLDQTIEAWFPDAPNASVTTIEQLLRHTSGLVSFNALPSWTLDYRTPREAIALATAEPPQFCPGTNWAYTNTGYAMLGVIVERLEEKPLHEVFAARLISPLGLEHTTLRQRGDAAAVASGHVGGRPADVPEGYVTPFAAGGLASTAEDLVTFWHALLGGRVLPGETVRAMFTAMSPMPPAGQMFYGRGVQFYDIANGPGVMLGHSGGITGFTSIVAYVAADDLYVAVIFNEQQVPAEAGLWAIVRAIRAAR